LTKKPERVLVWLTVTLHRMINLKKKRTFRLIKYASAFCIFIYNKDQ
jgi:hypothetical protein